MSGQNHTARDVALWALVACEKQGAWSDGFLKKELSAVSLDTRDAALATRLCFGVQQNRMLLDFYLGQLSTVKLEKMEPSIRNILRLGAYQVLFLNRVPNHAAVSQSVGQAKAHSRNPKASGLVNGILRSLIRQLNDLPQPENLSVRYSHPQWLVDAFAEQLPAAEVEDLLRADNGEPPTYIQTNTCKVDTPALVELLAQEGMAVHPHPWIPDCLLLEHTGSLERSPAFEQGLFYVQDSAARLSVLAAGPAPGMEVLDACAAPGGKSFASAIAMGGQGRVISCDIHPHKINLLRAGAQRLGLDCITPELLDGKVCKAEFLNKFDLVIADVPCSGLGIIRKKPDIRYKDPGPLEGLPKVQRAILENVSRYIKPGGILLYATCTLLRRENEENVDFFLEKHSNFTLEPFQLPQPFGSCENGMVTCWPHRHGTDGFFFAKLRRNA